MEFRILTATPGLRKDQVAEKIAAHVRSLRKDDRDLIVHVDDVETELCRLLPQGHATEEDQLAQALARSPQDKTRSLWKVAFLNAVTTATAGNPDLAVVVASLCYYRRQTYEFYCPVDFRMLTEYQSTGRIPADGAIVTVVDDIFDLYHRLSRGEHVFSIQRLVDELEVDEKETRTNRYKRVMGLVIQSLIRVLEWRESELQLASALAATLGWNAHMLAVKHPVATGVRVLLGKKCPDFGLGHTLCVYLSHPISVPRRENSRTGKRPPFVSEFDDFIRHLRSNDERDVHITSIMPTAIDEYRFLRDGDRLLPYLAPRWPLPSACNKGEPRDLLYSAIGDGENYHDYEKSELQKIFDPPLDSSGASVGLPSCEDRVAGTLTGDNEVGGMLKTLESMIHLQMANRDHLLVRQCPGFLLYRPIFKEARFTGGVRAEIRDQHDLREFESAEHSYGRPMAFVHSVSDLEMMFATESYAVEAAIREIVKSAEEVLKGHTDVRVATPTREAVSRALADSGDPDRGVQALYQQLYRSETGSIGRFEPPSLQAVRSSLRDTLIEERVRQLAGGRAWGGGWKWKYVAVGIDGAVVFEESNVSGETHHGPIILVLVVADLDSSSSQQGIAADHVRRHFADRFLAA